MQKVGGGQGELLTGTMPQNVIEMQYAAAAKQAEEQKKNREIILKLMRSIYFLAKNRIHT